MRFQLTIVVLSLSAAMAACSIAQERIAAPAPVGEPVPGAQATPAEPLAGFARMVGGEWKMTAAAGTSMYDTWHWGPGRRSLRVMTDGLGADGNPWRALRVVYWDPGRGQIRTLGLSPYRAGVDEGDVVFDGESPENTFDMYQTGVRRSLKTRTTFDGPDKYHSELMEKTGAEGYFPLAAWDWIRVAPPATPRPWEVEGAVMPSEQLGAFGPLLGHTWETEGHPTGEWADEGALHLRASFEWIPLANGIYMRTVVPAKEGEATPHTHLLDAYFYHHTGAGTLRGLVLSRRGAYEGDVIVLDGVGERGGAGGLQLDLRGSEGDRVVSYVVRLDFEQDGRLRQRVWSAPAAPAERTLMLDARLRKVEPKAGGAAGGRSTRDIGTTVR